MAGLELQGGRSAQSTATPDVAPKPTLTAAQGSSIFLAQSEARAHASPEREASRLINRVVPHPHHTECPLPHSFWRFAQARLRCAAIPGPFLQSIGDNSGQGRVP